MSAIRSETESERVVTLSVAAAALCSALAGAAEFTEGSDGPFVLPFSHRTCEHIAELCEYVASRGPSAETWDAGTVKPREPQPEFLARLTSESLLSLVSAAIFLDAPRVQAVAQAAPRASLPEEPQILAAQRMPPGAPAEG